MLQDISSNNKRIAKNTFLLYCRMLILLVVGLFTSRVILQALGVENYGILSVVVGFLGIFSFITSSMTTAIGRFITVELGKNNLFRLKQVFSTSVTVQFLMGILILFLVETFGYWFLQTKMNIPAGRETAALWCLHCAAISSALTLFTTPFQSCIIAHEKMGAFAYLSLFEAFMKLLICYLVFVSPADKLITYAILLVMVNFLNISFYIIYSLRKFEECTFVFTFDRRLFKEIWNFAGWNMFGNGAWILNTQGVNMLLNIYYGVIVNAARGIADQVNNIILMFVNNFMMALNPQITKSYAAGDKEYAYSLACRGSRFSFYIMYLLGLPLMIEAKQILQLWLGTPPEQSDAFLVWIILSSFTTTIGNTIGTLQMAQGNIKRYQTIMTSFASLIFPFTWIAYYLGGTPIYTYYIFAFIYWCLIFLRFRLVHTSTGISYHQYLVGVVLRCHIVGIVSAIIPLLIALIMYPSFLRLLLVCIASTTSIVLTIYTIGLEKSERAMIISKVRSTLYTLTHND